MAPAGEGQQVTMSELAEENRKHWDDQASIYYKEPWQKKFEKEAMSTMLARKDWLGVDWASGKVRVLDYACGPGAVSSVYAPYAAEVRGMDISSNMVKAFEERAKNAGLESKMSAIVANIVVDGGAGAEAVSEPSWFDFDLVFSGFALHHFPDPAMGAKRLVERARPGTGVVVFSDVFSFKLDTLGRTDGHDHRHDDHDLHNGDDPEHEQGSDASEEKVKERMKRIISKHGFSVEEVTRILEDAGCEAVEIVPIDEPMEMVMGGKSVNMPWFIAKGRRKRSAS